MKAPIVKKRVQPDYVPVAPGVAVKGVILIEAIVTKEGKVRHVKVLSDSDEENAKRLAEAVKLWEFEPGTLDGEPVDVIFNLSSYIHYR